MAVRAVEGQWLPCWLVVTIVNGRYGRRFEDGVLSKNLWFVSYSERVV